MGRRINISTPAVINTELVPLDESFYLDVDGQLEQWYYDNTEQYAPNRKVTPLLIEPKISAFDKDTSTSYTPSFNTTQWFETAFREDYSIRHAFAASSRAQAEAGREYPSDISSWGSTPLNSSPKPYLWHRTTKTIGNSTTVTYELVKVKDTPIYVLTNVLSYFPDDPEVGDRVLSSHPNVDYYVYQGNGNWEDFYLNEGQALDVSDLEEIWVLVNDGSYGKWHRISYSAQNGGYIETEITNTVDSGSADYVIQGNNLLVKKNVSYSHAVSIRCVATYIDPRDSGVTYMVESSVNLTTNRTADVVFPEVDIISPSGRSYNPLVDDTNSQYDFKGVTTNNPVQPLNTDVRRYSVDVDGTEEILNSGEAVAPIMDIRYGNNPTMEDQEFMYRQTADGELVGESIDKAYIEKVKGNTVAWNQLYKYGGTLSPSPNKGTVSINDVARHYVYTITSIGTNMWDNRLVLFPEVSFGGGHKYYVSFKIKPKTANKIGVSGNNFERNVQSDNLVGNAWNTVGVIFNPTEDYNGNQFWINFNCVSGYSVGDTIEVDEIDLIDLTLIYGAGNEPSTPEEFEADYERWFGKPLSYEEYDEGSLRPVLMQSVKTTGFNQWDGVIENGYYEVGTGLPKNGGNWKRSKNPIPCFPNTNYYLRASEGFAYLLYYDSSMNYITSSYDIGGGRNQINTTPSNCHFIHFYGSELMDLSTLCINISNPSKNGTYEPYKGKVQGFDVTTIKGKLNGAGESVTIFPDGLKKAGDVQDEIFVEGGVVKAIKRVGSRAYESGDENNSAVITDGSTTTFYALSEPIEYVLDPIAEFVWYGMKNGVEVLADTLPWYVSGQGTDNLVVDAMYGENINVVLRCKMMDGETLSPSKAYASLSWRMPDIDTNVQSENGSAVRSDTEEMTFDTIVNVNGTVLSDEMKQKHLAFNWKIRKNNVSTETDKGWGQRITIDASDLRNVKGSGSTLASTLVYPYVYLKGAYEEVTDNGEVVTDNGEVVYDRPVD